MKTLLIVLGIFTLGCAYGNVWEQDVRKSGVIIEDDIMMSESEDPWDRHPLSNDIINKRWAEGIVPYDFNKTEYSVLDLYHIKEGLREIEKDTCIKFVPRIDEINYIYITPLDGCWSYLGRQGSAQVLSLTVPQCISKGIVIHEFMHALGFWHEHSRPDRDEFIDILWDNIINEEKQANFIKQRTYWQAWTDIPYDYKSVLHYSAYAFSKSPYLPTLKPKKAQVRLKDLGRAKVVGTLTDFDKHKVNTLYDCLLT